MRIIKGIVILFCIIFFTVGCKNSETIALKKEAEDQKGAIQQLELANQKMTEELREIKNELQTKTNDRSALDIKNQLLNQKITELELNEKSFKVYEEKLVFHPNLLLPQTMSIKAVKALLGEPLKVEEAIEAHAPAKSITLTYDKAAYIFNSNEGKETIKSYRIKDASFATNRGITIGSTRDEVHKAYDTSYYDYFENKSEITFGEKTGMFFKLQNDKANEFSVWFVYE